MKTLSSILLLCFMTVLLPASLAAGARAIAGSPVAKQNNSDGGNDKDEAGAAQVLEKYITAIGGREKLETLRTSVEDSEAEVQGGMQRSHVVLDLTKGKLYNKTEGSEGVIEQGFDGQHAWRKASFFHGVLPDTDAFTKNMLHRQPELWQYKTRGNKFHLRPSEKVDGTDYLVVETTIQNPVTGEVAPARFYFDPKTYLLRQAVRGAAIKRVTVFDDYRSVDGVMEPFVETIKGPRQTITRKVKSFRFNLPVEDSLFQYHEDSEPAASQASSSVPAPSSGNNAVTTGARTEASVRGGMIDEKTRMDTFELVWKTVNDSYWDPKMGGVDWRAVHDQYLPKAKATTESDAFHELLNKMLGELDRSHFRITLPQARIGLATSETDLQNLENADPGVDLRWVDGQLLVVDVQKGFPAEAAGIRKGYVLLKIDGKGPDEMLKEYQKKNPGFQLREPFERVRAAFQQLSGKANTEVSVEVLDAGNQTVKLQLKRRATPVDATPLEFESKRLEHNVGYIAFSAFDGAILPKFDQAMKDLHDTSALIIDIRGNGGGVGRIAPLLANRLSSTAGSLGTMHLRYGSQEYAYAGSGKDAYAGKVFLLVDELSGSTSEVFAAGLQENGRAIVIGAPTAAAVLPSLQTVLPTGSILHYVVADFRTPEGTLLEGRGVTPDVIAPLSRASLLRGEDPALLAALNRLAASRE